MSVDLSFGPASMRDAVGVKATARWNWTVVWLVAFATRLAAVFLLPNAELDGYSYVQTIAVYSEKLAHGEFHFADLAGFWLPLFQFLSAVVNLVVGDPLLAGKLVAGVSGAIACVLVYAITRELTRHHGFALLAFVLVLTNPLHLLYSAAAMTDIPFGCVLLASVWFALRERWLGCALCAALAEGVRIEAWGFLLLVPALQFWRTRRISLLNCAILVLPIAGWFVVCHAATGSFFSYFEQRAIYQARYLDFHPSRKGLAWPDISQDISYFLIGANRVVLTGSFIISGWCLVRLTRRDAQAAWQLLIVAAYAFSILGMIVFAYLTRKQPVILPRYGLFLFVLGNPLLMTGLYWLGAAWKSLSATLGIFLVIGLSFYQSVWQLPILQKTIANSHSEERMAQALVSDRKSGGDPTVRCFTDDVAVQVLSRLPRGNFLSSRDVPPEARANAAAFQSYLREQNVSHLVFIRTEDSIPVDLFPELGQQPDARTGAFQFVTMAPSDFGPSIWLYRLTKTD